MQINDFILNVEIEEVLAELRRQLVLNGFDYLEKEPKPSGNSVQVQCPYHGDGKERRPSAGIRRTDGMFHCFACNEVHTLPEVISHCFGKNEDVAGAWGWKWLLKNFAVVQVEERKDVALDFVRAGLAHKFDPDKNTGTGVGGLCGEKQSSRQADPEFVTETELESYRYYHPYMYKRKLTDDIIELFDVGFDKKTNCITFPIRDQEGNCLFVARRSVLTKFFQYPAGSEKPLYGLYELYKEHREHEDLVICESMLDALTVWVYGKTAVALNGLGNDLQFKQLNSLPCRKVILGTDNDDAGMRARARIRKHLHGKIITEYVFPEDKKDLNELDLQGFEALEEVF